MTDGHGNLNPGCGIVIMLIAAALVFMMLSGAAGVATGHTFQDGLRGPARGIQKCVFEPYDAERCPAWK